MAVLAAGVFALAASGDKSGTSSSKSSSSSHPAEADVKVTTCAFPDNEFEGPQAKVTVTNHSSKSSNYLIEVAFESPDAKTQLDTGTAVVNNLAAGQTASTDATSIKSDLRKSSPQYTCRVSDVTRLAA